MNTSDPKTLVIALGGNALSSPTGDGSFEEQQEAIRKSSEQIIKIIQLGWKVVVTHGNGPQIGRLLIQQESAKEITPALPLHLCGAMSQGQIGYMLQLGLEEKIRAANLKADIVAILTRVLVDENDPAFDNPTKPIGPFYSQEEALDLKESKSYEMKNVGFGERPFRRVVASPKPLKILEVNTIEILIKSGNIVIACGGGGIPVINHNGILKGIGAVIDKDLSSQKLANEISADSLMILTDVNRVSINFDSREQKDLQSISLLEVKQHFADGQFPDGSMGPKVLSAINFLENGGQRVIITSLDKAAESLSGSAGTQIFND
jgi:carbamate kinase